MHFRVETFQPRRNRIRIQLHTSTARMAAKIVAIQMGGFVHEFKKCRRTMTMNGPALRYYVYLDPNLPSFPIGSVYVLITEEEE